MNYNALHIGQFCRWLTCTGMFIEGSDDGTDFIIEGQFNTIMGVRAFAGARTVFDFRSTSMSNQLVASEAAINRENGIGIRMRGTYNKAIGVHVIHAGSAPNITGVQMEGAVNADNQLIGVSYNPASPWSALSAGSVAFRDLTTDAASSDVSRGRTGIQSFRTLDDGNYGQGLWRGAVSYRWETKVLTQADVDSTPRIGTLHLSPCNVMTFTPTAAVNVRAFEAENGSGKHFWLFCTNNNPTFVVNAYLINATGNYTPPASGAIIEFLISPAGIAYILSIKEL